MADDLEAFQRRADDAIATERARQIYEEGYSHWRDADHGAGTLSMAAYAYAYASPAAWPWEARYYKPKGAVRDLVRAGALYQAALDVVEAAGGSRRDIDAGLADVRRRLALTLHEAAEVLA